MIKSDEEYRGDFRVKTPLEAEQRKRDRPLSSYFDSPCDRTTDDELSAGSPILNKAALRNISNLVFPSMKKWTAKGITRSMTAVSETSKFFTSAASPKKLIKENTVSAGLGNMCQSVSKQGSLKGTEARNLDIFEKPDDNESDVVENDAVGSPTQIRQSNNIHREFRRTHSLFQTTKEKEGFFMEDNCHLHKTSIKTFKVDDDLLPRIDEDEMISIMKGHHKHEFDEVIIVDCRFSYEFEGGHIDGAINISCQKELESKFLERSKINDKKQLLVFHCEFSSFRGPNMAKYLRKCDRQINSHEYPKLSYPDIVILSGGYKRFFDKFKLFCIPQGYVEMNDVNYQERCESEMNKVRQANKLTRTKSQNYFFHNHSLANTHVRSHSYSTTTSHTQNLKILKRHKSSLSGASSSRLKCSSISSDQSIFNKSNDVYAPVPGSENVSATTSVDDLVPPFSSFGPDHRGFYSYASDASSSSFSMDSSSSVGIDTANSSSDSLISPTDEYDIKSSNLTAYMRNLATSGNNQSCGHVPIKSSVLNPMSRKPLGLPPALPRSKTLAVSSKGGKGTLIPVQNLKNSPISSFKFPSTKSCTNQMNVSTISKSTGISVTSPTISSPLSTMEPIATNELCLNGKESSIIDPINEVPVDFSVPYPNSVKLNSGPRSLLSSGRESYFNE
ncbi:uncharacterized protein PRCAT00003071001 [Priceomyces carsonii]|uniref:uncharacterized protein n=1 Tax=Priceomyces carsonii TaxID=28549 RepID=UPI002ED9DCFA|nr:unnamed protein product [Priceomyces carsonii]